MCSSACAAYSNSVNTTSESKNTPAIRTYRRRMVVLSRNTVICSAIANADKTSISGQFCNTYSFIIEYPFNGDRAGKRAGAPRTTKKIITGVLYHYSTPGAEKQVAAADRFYVSIVVRRALHGAPSAPAKFNGAALNR